MKRKASIVVLFCGLLLGMSLVGVVAQTPTLTNAIGNGSVLTQAPAPTAPVQASVVPAVAYTENERLMVQLVQLSDQLASCRQQLGQKGIADLGDDVRARIEAAHPGFTIDWKTGALVAKTPPPTKTK